MSTAVEFETFIQRSRLVSDKYSSCFIQLVGSVHLAKVMAIHFAVYHMPHNWCYVEIAGYKHTIRYIVFV